MTYRDATPLKTSFYDVKFVARFKLNHNSTRLQPGEVDTSIWVGDLTPDVSTHSKKIILLSGRKTRTLNIPPF